MTRIEIDPLVDFACHLLLGSPDHPRITIHFLNSVLDLADPIVEVRILNPIVGKDFAEDKLAVLDILATDSIGRIFNIEVQRSVHAGLAKRITYYVATQLVRQLGEGEGYQKLRPSIGICILDDNLVPNVPQYHHDFQLRSGDGLLFTDCVQIHLLELPKYRSSSDTNKPLGGKNQWFHFFVRANGADPLRLLDELSDPVFAEAIGVLEMIQRSPDERRIYESRLKFQRDEQARLDDAREEGEKRGELLGKIEGKIEGELRGEIKGKILILQEVLSLPVSSKSELDSKTTEDLESLLIELQSKFRKRTQTQ